MSRYSEDGDSPFWAAGAKPGLEIWCIEKLRLVPVPKSLYGKFFSGSAFVVLNTVLLKNGPPQHDIHYWLGKDANEVESALASDKALELDSALGSCTVQYREVQGQETWKFLSYFKPCIIPIEGVYSSPSGNLDGESYKASLLSCKGDHAVSVKEVDFSRSSLNHNDVFILDTASKIFLFCGCNSSIQERAKALEVVQYIKDNKHGGKCEVATIEDGKFVGDSDVGEFWSLFGGYAPIPRDSPSAMVKQSDSPSAQLFWITTQGKLCPSESCSLSKEMLEANKCYMLDSGAEIYVWMGRNTLVTERKTSISAIEDFLRGQGRSTTTHLTFLTEGLETSLFKSYFEAWPQIVEPKLYEEGRGKVAAIFKHQGYDVKELHDVEDSLPYINCRGKLKVWRVNGDEMILIPDAEQRKLYGGDCYIVQYTYASEERDENLLYAWIGQESVLEDRVDSISNLNNILDSTKGDPVMVQIFQDNEPLLFFLIFQTVIVFKGGLSTRYKKSIAEKSIPDETFDETKTALFRIQGKSLENMQAIQVNQVGSSIDNELKLMQVASSLNSSYCYILQTESTTFSWMGGLSTATDHGLLDRMLELINPTWQPVSVREGSEPDTFWDALGGKTEYPREKEIKRHVEDPNLFTFTSANGDFKVKEIYNFTQDDLATEDVLVLNCHEELYVWVGCHSDVKSKQQALTFGKEFLQIDPLGEKLPLETSIYVIAEGQEPPYFTRFFEWDRSMANMHGNSFERKLAILKGNKQNLEAPVRNSWKASSRESTPDSFRSKSLASNGRRSCLSPASNISVSSFNSSKNHLYESPTPIARKLFTSSPYNGNAGNGRSFDSPAVPDPIPPSQNADLVPVEGIDANISSLIYPYERLKVDSSDPVTGINVTKREVYLSDEEFEEKFGMVRRAFYELPKWKQNKLKMSIFLF